jgi:diguanylate cyclase (GGDEF)-like protein
MQARAHMSDVEGMALRRAIGAAWKRGSAPSPARTIATYSAAGGICTVLGSIFPPNEAAPVETLRVLGIIALACSFGVFLIGERMPNWGLHVAVAAGTVAISIAVSQTATGLGMVVTATAYLWIAIYTGLFFSRPAARWHMVLIAVGFGAALEIGDQGVPVNAWVFMIVSLFVAGETLGRQSDRLRFEAHTDSLTGVLNRNGLVTASQRAFSLADRTGIPVTAILIDLDDFKAVNDRDGHVAGDRLLTQVATAWAEELEPSDIIARIGGDEFIVFLVGSDEAAARHLLDRMRLLSPAPWSAGVAARAQGEDLDSSVATADTALYEAKRGPRAHRIGDLVEALSA